MLKFLNIKPEVFGLDISDLSLKIIKLKKKKGDLSLASFSEEKIKPGLIKKGQIKDEKALIEVLKKAVLNVKGEKLKTNYIIASLPEEETFLQVIQMPKMKEEELKEAVRFEAENYIPLPINDLYLDFEVIKPVYDNLDYLDVLVAALPKKIVDSYVFCFKEAGLIPIALEVESLAICRALIKNQVSPYPILLIDFGATKTGFIIFSGSGLHFTFSIPISSQKLTEAISKTLNKDLVLAENLKLKYGLKKGTDLSFKQRKKYKGEAEEVFDAIIPSLVDLVEQIKNHLSFYQSHARQENLPSGRKGIERILLCGGGANLKGILSFLSLELKFPVELGNPWINILKEPQKETKDLPYAESLKYATTLGLALRGIKAND